MICVFYNTQENVRYKKRDHHYQMANIAADHPAAIKNSNTNCQMKS